MLVTGGFVGSFWHFTRILWLLVQLKSAMDSSTSSTCQIPEIGIKALKEAFCAQQQLLQKLYSELDEEREASASAASEALSMILRLQGEKAAVEMEAIQYKRMTEEKMCIADEYLATYEELVYQKETEIASLEFQIQAYRWKMLSLGCSDLSVGENKYSENLVLQRGDVLLGEMGNLKIRRLQSLPAMIQDPSQKKSPTERERSLIPGPDFIPRVVEETIGEDVKFQNSGLEKKSGNSAGGDSSSQWNRIGKILKEISDHKDKPENLKNESRSYLLNSHGSSITCCTKGDEVIKFESSGEREAVEYSACPASVHDKFEVPKTFEKCKTCGDEEKEKYKLILEGDNRISKPDSVLEETFESYSENNETDGVKSMLLSANHEKGLFKPRDVSVDCKVALIRPTIDAAKHQSEIQKLRQRIEQLERERIIERNEISQAGGSESIWLMEIHERLNSIQSEMRSWRSKKSIPPDDSSSVTVMEAMLHFWL
ncbi:Zein-binding domain-containing protein [Cephalotus follicularis]|uniref:Zein-binding domain-containing protein n=1 Tax=Cephalotus follicularis TaxID=3775 RepID=A0A1Q3D8M6_CEPFO|nr:Zein-binding domain-containing protein [Cephalotus follicularis]